MSVTTSTALWYASRATGVVALALLTVVAVLGILVSRQRALPGLPRFVTTSLHRNLSLLAVTFLAVHIVTAIADPYVTIGIAAAIIPFSSPYESFWLGLGAISVDLIIALIMTSLLRARIGRRAWRVVHWLSYAAWPAALAHSLGASRDLRHGYLLCLTLGCITAVAAAAMWRLVGAALAPNRTTLPARTLAAAQQAPAAGSLENRPAARAGAR